MVLDYRPILMPGASDVRILVEDGQLNARYFDRKKSASHEPTEASANDGDLRYIVNKQLR